MEVSLQHHLHLMAMASDKEQMSYIQTVFFVPHGKAEGGCLVCVHKKRTYAAAVIKVDFIQALFICIHKTPIGNIRLKKQTSKGFHFSRQITTKAGPVLNWHQF